MNPPFPAGLPFKMFHRVSDINMRSIDSSFLERAVHDFSGRTNERFARDIFVIAWLFANQHHRCPLGTFAKYGLSRSFVQMTCNAARCCFAQGSQT
jgi:hypothetical protein